MNMNFINKPEMARINYWFDYARNLCETYKCEDCPLVGGQTIQTDVSILRCVTGKNKKAIGDGNEQGAGKDS